jgi:adenine-specific DNA methylase
LDTDKTFRPIHYLGSKLRILDFINNVIDEIDPNKGQVCDLFSGSGSVSRHLSKTRPVVSVDIQEYSNVICNAILYPIQYSKIDNFIDKCKNSDYYIKLLLALKPIIYYEETCIKNALDGNPEPLCEFLENGSLIKLEKTGDVICSNELKEALYSSLEGLKKYNLNDNKVLISRYFGGVYFSYKQCVELDAILEEIPNEKDKYKYLLLSSLISTASDIVNTVGNQFAQPIQPRKKDGSPKKNIGNMAFKDRSKNVFTIYANWISKYTNLKKSEFKHTILKCDYLKALESLDTTTKIVYADPPYTRDHYSRFYHVLETICLKDFPEISKIKVNGIIDLSRALYREERHQSPFCIKSKALEAFEKMLNKISQINASLVLSYSPFDDSVKSHPRVMTIDQILKLGSKYFNNISQICPGEFVHSKFNHAEKNFAIKTHGEILIIFKND